MLARVSLEAGTSAVILGIAVVCFRAAIGKGEGPAGASVRLIATLLLPAVALAFAHAYFWPLSLAASVLIAAVQLRAGAAPRILAVDWFWVLVPAGLLLVLLATKAALAIASIPYDVDSNLYHLPMAIEYLQAHTALPAQIMFHPGDSELLDALGLGALGSVGGQTLTEALVALTLFLAAYGLAEEAGAPPHARVLAACAVFSVPMIADQLFTAQNDILVATLLLAGTALWRRSPFLSALAFGLAAGTKFTGALEAAVLLLVLWRRRSPELSWRHAALAGAIASPWYIRNAIETGNPFFVGDQVAGFQSAIADHLASAAPFVFLAIRNYGGLLALLGIVALLYLARRPELKGTLSPLLPALAAAVLLTWFITPNSAETTAGALNQIRSGWSIRYALFAVAVLDIAAVFWLARINLRLAAGVTALSLAFTTLREYNSSLHVDAGTLAFVLPLIVAGAAAASCFALGMRRSIAAGSLACLVFAVAAALGSVRIASIWNQRYTTQSNVGMLLRLPELQDATRAAVIDVPALAVMGPHFARYAVISNNGLSVPAWWKRVEAERPQVVVAADIPHSGRRVSENERFLRATELFRLVARRNGVRVYVPR